MYRETQPPCSWDYLDSSPLPELSALAPVGSPAGLPISDSGPRAPSASPELLHHPSCLAPYERRGSLVVLLSLLLGQPEGAHPSKFVYTECCCSQSAVARSEYSNCQPND